MDQGAEHRVGKITGAFISMTFEDFARAHGLIMRGLTLGKWVAVPTEDHPRKRNGRYKCLGDIGWVQNWATMERPEMWRSDATVKPQRIITKPDNDAAKRAAEKAEWILSQTALEFHPYLEKKGFPTEAGNVWTTQDGTRLLVIPMRLSGRIIGCQLIDDQGGKKFLRGQQTKGAAFVMGAHGVPVFCEGYATGLSLKAVMRAMKIRHSIYVCFSAGNFQNVARNVEGGIVVADNDPNGIGEKAARSTGKAYWLSDTVGEDFNDYHVRVGLFRAMLPLKKVIFDSARAASSETSVQSDARAPA
jgi:putative DNA primase/helicase